MKTMVHRLLDGTLLRLEDLERHEVEFLKTLRKMARDGVFYFEISRFALGPGSPALRGGSLLTLDILNSPLHRAAADISERAGIDQGLVLAPKYRDLPRPKTLKRPLSVVQAAEVINISRIAVYQAMDAGRLPFTRIGNVRVIELKDAQAYRRRREARRKKAK